MRHHLLKVLTMRVTSLLSTNLLLNPFKLMKLRVILDVFLLKMLSILTYCYNHVMTLVTMIFDLHLHNHLHQFF